MPRKIKVKISNREYVVTVQTEEDEQFVRQAADKVTASEADFMSKYPGRGQVDVLSIIALNAFVSNFKYHKVVDGIDREVRDLEEQTKSYLDSLD